MHHLAAAPTLPAPKQIFRPPLRAPKSSILAERCWFFDPAPGREKFSLSIVQPSVTKAGNPKNRVSKAAPQNTCCCSPVPIFFHLSGQQSVFLELVHIYKLNYIYTYIYIYIYIYIYSINMGPTQIGWPICNNSSVWFLLLRKLCYNMLQQITHCCIKCDSNI